jgi:ATP/maltotriose-dependent transcriptional regulator MalT
MTDGDWSAAADAFARAVAADPTAEAYERLAEAHWWQNHEVPTFEARERAYHLYRRQGDAASAARLAMLLAEDALEFRGESAVCNGWMRRARRLLRGRESAREYGWLQMQEGHLALMLRNDTAAAARLGAAATELARATDHVELEMLGLAVEGLARVSAGDIDEGMARLDEAAALSVSEETRDVLAKGTALCYMMDACDRVRDFDRAWQWCARAEALAIRWRTDFLPALCRPHLAVVLMWRGQWDEAEQALTDSATMIQAMRPSMAAESVIRLAELRVRQGRLDEAQVLFDEYAHDGLAHVGIGELALARGDAAKAAEFAERRLRHLPAGNRIERAPALELLIRARVALGDLSAADDAWSELQAAAEEIGTAPLLGAAHYTGALLASARGEAELARVRFEDAIDCFRRDRAPFEAARARIDLAVLLRALGRVDEAQIELNAAMSALEGLGATVEAARAAALLAAPVDASRSLRGTDGLTARELDVLRTLAAGASNQEIAARLFMSTRTVERHVSNIYDKLGLSGRHARASATAWAYTHGLAERAGA